MEIFMRAYQIAAASAVMCSSLLLTSYLKAAEVDEAGPVAQMNRASYAMRGESAASPMTALPRHPEDQRQYVAQVAQMNRGQYARPVPLLLLPRRPEDQRQYMPVVAQSNRALYDR
jgi:hypothetical protein